MGCCVSTKSAPSSAKDQHLHAKRESFNQKSAAFESRAPPPSFEEETVKEVLSEVPKPKPCVPLREDEKENDKTHKQKPAIEKIPEKESLDFSKTEQKWPAKPHKSAAALEDSLSEDVSDICSLSMSESVSTTTITDRREDDEEVRQRAFRSPARLAPRNREYLPKRDRVVGRSPNRRPDQSPARRNGNANSGSVRPVQSREPGAGIARRGSRTDPNKRDPGESSGRRSRSPAVNRSAAMGRSPSMRRTNRSPARVRVDPDQAGPLLPPHPSQKLLESNNLEGKWPSNHSNGAGNPANESLENPLVSLECFIFL